MNKKSSIDRRLLVLAGVAGAAGGTAVWLTGCQTAPPPGPTAPPAAPTPPNARTELPAPPPTPITNMRTSSAATPKAYREDAATHMYGLHRDRIWKGKLPPLLYAVGVLQVDVDASGKVSGINWMRAPRHAPEVIAEIEKMVRSAAPYPAPVRMGKVTWTDTWLWHKSGQFQLDTLTEGQL